MSYNKQKMVQLILNECETIEERCDGYRKEVIDAVVKVLTAEKEHQVQKTSIQKQVDAECYAAGDFLHRKRDVDTSTTEAAK